MTGLRVLVDVCIFQLLQVPVRQPGHRFYHKAANGDSAYWNGTPALFLLAATWRPAGTLPWEYMPLGHTHMDIEHLDACKGSQQKVDKACGVICLHGVQTSGGLRSRRSPDLG